MVQLACIWDHGTMGHCCRHSSRMQPSLRSTGAPPSPPHGDITYLTSTNEVLSTQTRHLPRHQRHIKSCARRWGGQRAGVNSPVTPKLSVLCTRGHVRNIYSRLWARFGRAWLRTLPCTSTCTPRTPSWDTRYYLWHPGIFDRTYTTGLGDRIRARPLVPLWVQQLW